ncbi:hypothetical protein V2S84_11995, partial [Azotobacter chroococcum]|nr:hypothetical protein [Azotobacter chroococcum]
LSLTGKGGFPLQPTAKHLDVQTPNAPYLAERKTFCVFRRPSAPALQTRKKRPKSPARRLSAAAEETNKSLIQKN